MQCYDQEMDFCEVTGHIASQQICHWMHQPQRPSTVEISQYSRNKAFTGETSSDKFVLMLRPIT